MGRTPLAFVVAAALVWGLAAAPAAAERRLKAHHRRDVPIIAIGAILYTVGEVAAKDSLSPSACRWCASNGFDTAVRDKLRWSSTGTAHTLSNIVGFGVTPIVAAAMTDLVGGLDGRGGDWFHNGVILAETGVLAATVNYVVKALVGRERPFVHALAPGDKAGTADPADNNLSFYSGHSTLAMSLAVGAGTTATLRGYRRAWLVWATTVPMALATGYLRIGADKHWASDVLTGWALGAGFGVAVPYLLHTECGPSTPMPVVARGGGATTVGVALAW
ncbi:MAG: phosphatase PAP2 family protein [Myxococcales bacterium]|nr:phosphatase PAP2 family protein [Myxococcales bacterium]